MMEENAIGAREELTSKAVMVFLEQGYPTGPSSARDIAKGIIDRSLADVPLLMAVVGAVEIIWCDVHEEPYLALWDMCLKWFISDKSGHSCHREDPPTHWKVT